MMHTDNTKHSHVSRLTCAAGLLGCPLVCCFQDEQRFKEHVCWRLPHKLPHKVLEPLQAAALRAAPLPVTLVNDAPLLCFTFPLLEIPAPSGGNTCIRKCSRLSLPSGHLPQ